MQLAGQSKFFKRYILTDLEVFEVCHFMVNKLEIVYHQNGHYVIIQLNFKKISTR